MMAMLGAQQRDDTIDALRGVAILLVVAYHYTARFAGDYTGIEVNFSNLGIDRAGVFSSSSSAADCIAMTAERAPTVQHFWLRRFTRLQPAFVACILLTLLIVNAIGLPGREPSLANALSNAAWISLFSPSRLVDGAYWSLLVEVKFYFVFGLLFYLWPKAGLAAVSPSRRSASRCKCRPSAPIIARWIYPFRSVSKSLLPFSLQPVLPRRNFGAPLQPSHPRCRDRRVRRDHVCAGRRIVAFRLGRGRDRCWRGRPQVRDVPMWKPLVFVGLISYPLYLLHESIGLAIIRSLDPLIHSGLLRIAIATAAVMLLATAVAWSVEHRFRRRYRRAFMRFSLFACRKRRRPRSPEAGGRGVERESRHFCAATVRPRS